MSGYSELPYDGHPKFGKPPVSYQTPEERQALSMKQGIPVPDVDADSQAQPVMIRTVPDGILGTATILAEMSALALDAYRDERVNQLARQVTISCPRHDTQAEAAAVLDWFQRTFRYTSLPHHPAGLQRLQTPSYTLFDAPSKTGECASLCTAMAAMLMSLGHQVAWRTGGTNPSDHEDFEHVWCIDMIDGSAVDMDPSYEGGLGWRHPAAAVMRDWPIE